MIEIYALKLTEQLHRPVENFSVGNGIIGLCAKKGTLPPGIVLVSRSFFDDLY